MKTFLSISLLAAGLAFFTMAEQADAAKKVSGPLRASSVNAFKAYEDGIERVEKYLKNLTTLRADFQQVAPDGSFANGKFYLQRPGKMRWDYAPPSKVLLISDGETITYFDGELDQVNYVSVDDTIAGFLAQDDLRLNSEVTQLKKFNVTPGAIRATIEQRNNPDYGSLTLVFTDKPLALKQFMIVDAAGNETNIALSELESGVELDEKLFIFKDPRGVVDKYRNR